MSGNFRTSWNDASNASETELLGGTDQTKIGNVGDRLKVDASVSVTNLGIATWSSKLRYVDMNVASGGIARGTSINVASGWNTIFSYTGSGKLASFVVNLDTTADWLVRLIVDGEEIFPSTGFLLQDLTTDTLYDLDDTGKSAEEGLGFSHGLFVGSHATFHWKGSLDNPITYTSNVTIRIARNTGAAAKKFNAGLVILSKET